MNRTELTRSVIEKYFDAIGKVNNEGIEESLEMMTDDVIWINPLAIKQGGHFEGKQAVRDLLVEAINEIYVPNSMVQSNRRTIAEEGRGICTFDSQATTKNGKTYNQHFAIEIEVNEEGKMYYIRENFDTLAFQETVYQ